MNIAIVPLRGTIKCLASVVFFAPLRGTIKCLASVVFFASLAAAPAVISASASSRTDRELTGLLGPVKSVNVKTFTAVKKAGKWKEGRVKSILYSAYDKSGRKTEQARYYEDALISGSKFAYHDKKDDPFCENLKPDDPWGSSFYKDEETDIASFCHETGSAFYESVYIYDTIQKPDEPNRDNIEGVLQNRLLLVLDKKGNTVSEHKFDAWETLESGRIFEYDKKGRLVKIFKKNASDDLVEKRVYSYDRAGNIVSKFIFDSALGGTGLLISKKSFKYRKNSKTPDSEIFTEYNQDSSVSAKSDIVYDARGNRLKESFYSSNWNNYSHEYTYTYKFDQAGNWIKRTKTKVSISYGKKIQDKNTPPEITRREITYY